MSKPSKLTLLFLSVASWWRTILCSSILAISLGEIKGKTSKYREIYI